MVFRIGYASNMNFSNAYWFNDPQSAYDIVTGKEKDTRNTDKSIWIKKGNNAYQRISLEQLQKYIS